MANKASEFESAEILDRVGQKTGRVLVTVWTREINRDKEGVLKKDEFGALINPQSYLHDLNVLSKRAHEVLRGSLWDRLDVMEERRGWGGSPALKEAQEEIDAIDQELDLLAIGRMKDKRKIY